MTRLPILLLLAAALPAAALSEPDGLAPRLRAPTSEEPAFVLTAQGAQLFECKPNEAGDSYAWKFVSSDVQLFDGARSVATQTSPTQMESTADRTSVVASPLSSQDAGSGNLPWASFSAQATGDTGLFAGVTRILRVNTRGGVAPADGCDAGHTGTSTRVPFAADYYLYKRRAA